MLLTTERTNIRPLAMKDFKALVNMYLEPDSNKYVAPLRDKTEQFYLEFLNKKLLQNQEKQGFWVVELKTSHEIIGTVNLNFFEPLSIYHVGCHLMRAFWNKGLATELLLELIQYAKDVGVGEIHGIVQKENQVSLKLLKRLGFEFHREEILNGDSLEVYQLSFNE